MVDPDYRLRLSAGARRGLDRLPDGVAAAIAEFMTGDLLRSPRRVGKPLSRSLDGMWAARRGPFRVVYEMDDEEQAVTVLRIDHRSHAYRPR